MKTIAKHPVLPNGFDLFSPELASWLASQSVQTFIDKKRDNFSPEEIQDYEHESSLNGREFNRLSEIKSKVASLCQKGTEVAVTIIIPATVGSKVLDVQRRQNDDMIDRGYAEEDVEVYAIPYPEEKTMEFFDGDGKHYPDRTRPLSISEQHKFGGIFNMSRPSIQPFEGGNVDTESGEITGTNN